MSKKTARYIPIGSYTRLRADGGVIQTYKIGVSGLAVAPKIYVEWFVHPKVTSWSARILVNSKHAYSLYFLETRHYLKYLHKGKTYTRKWRQSVSLPFGQGYKLHISRIGTKLRTLAPTVLLERNSAI